MTKLATPLKCVYFPDKFIFTLKVKTTRPSSSLLLKNVKIKTHRNISLLVVLYGCETWSLTFKEKHRLREFENKVLRKIFGPKRDEVTG
jgi:hypothetical protein